MKRLRLSAAFLAILIFLSMSIGIVFAQEPGVKVPKPTAEFYCNDFAKILDSSTEGAIVSLGESTAKVTDGGQVVFVSIDTLKDSTIEVYANELFNSWKIGKDDKGILFIISMQERKARIEVGYGYEGVLTDIESNKLLQKFSELNKEKSLDEAVKTIYTDICSIVSGDADIVQYPDTGARTQTAGENNFFSEHPILSAVLIIIILILIILDFMLTGGQVTFFILRMAAASARRGGGGGRRNSGGGGRSGGGGSSSGF